MRLTQSIRQAYISSIMALVPGNAEDAKELIRDVALKDAINQLPKPVRAIYNCAETRSYIALQAISFPEYVGEETKVPYKLRSGYMYLPTNGERFTFSLDAKGVIDAILIEAINQIKAYADLEQKISAVARSATTCKQLAEMLPEFARFLLASEAAANRSLPVIANVVADFIKAGAKLPKIEVVAEATA